MHRIVHGRASCYLTESFGRVSQVHDADPLRETDLRLLDYMTLNHGKTAFDKKETKLIGIFETSCETLPNR